jgi:hypothetical protein
MAKHLKTEAVAEDSPWEYLLLLDAGSGYMNAFREEPWATLGRVQSYLASWRGKPEWAHLKVRVMRRRKAGRAHEVPAELYLGDLR